MFQILSNYFTFPLLAAQNKMEIKTVYIDNAEECIGALKSSEKLSC